jgi:hypothetical protein
MSNRHVTDRQQVLAELAREGPRSRGDTSALVWPGGGMALWVVKVKGHVEDNVYLVRTVTLEEPGVLPVEFGEPMEAVNLAEPFLEPGMLAPGTYAILCRVGEKNVFYALP